ncbi:type VI secretion system-associated protein TagF [Shewanella sp. WPAGA9]|nr:type VI secretion system-associated protein TagF [Shewanella sp. WPAGA9]
MSVESLMRLGYCGKVPSKGDFLQENLDIDFFKNWNEWLQAVIAVSKEQSGNEWLDYYLTSPVWHFSLSAGVCCEQAVVGTLIPSVDNVGRHYPFTLAGFHQQAAVCGWHENEWSTQFEAQILQVLEDDINLETWLNDVSGQQYTVPVAALCSSQSESSDITKKAWVIQGSNAPHILSLLDQQYRKQFERYSIWWTEGSSEVEACMIITEGLPQISQFVSMLSGQWIQRGWNTAALVKEQNTCT